jgi:uncharacterized paraquat-inducible protein A
MFMLVLVELLAVMATVWYVLRPRTEDPDADYFYINCEKCKQKIRYRERQVGNTAMCPRCRTPFVYPEIDDRD